MWPSDHRLVGDMMTYRGRCHSQVRKLKETVIARGSSFETKVCQAESISNHNIVFNNMVCRGAAECSSHPPTMYMHVSAYVRT